MDCVGEDSCKSLTFNCDLITDNEDCRLSCNGTASCSEAVVQCNENLFDDLIADCLGEDSCKGLVINCVGGDDDYRIDCNGKGSCADMVVTGGASDDLDIFCVGEDSCKSLILECTDEDSCEIDCDGKASCVDLVFDAENGNDLELVCEGDDACNGARIRCPNKDDPCDITCNTDGACIDMEVEFDPFERCVCLGSFCPSDGIPGCPGGTVALSSALRNNDKMINDDIDNSGTDGENEKKIIISFSEVTTINLWGIVGLLLIVNVTCTLFICLYKNKMKCCEDKTFLSS